MSNKRNSLESPADMSSPKRRRTSISQAKHADTMMPQEEKTEEASKDRAFPTTSGNNPDAKHSRHVRFDNEQFGSDLLNPGEDVELSQPALHQSGQDAGEQDSEDDAPDAFSTSAAQETAKASLSNAARAASQQRIEKKRRRKELDDRLKTQAKLAKKSARSKGPQGESQNRSSSPGGSHGASEDPTAPPADDLLPAHLLEEEFIRRQTPSPPPQSSQRGIRQEQGSPLTFSEKREQMLRKIPPKPRDKRVGPVNVSVLQKKSDVLAPKAEGTAKSLRERWLKGRKGRGGSILVERRLLSPGFVRR